MKEEAAVQKQGQEAASANSGGELVPVEPNVSFHFSSADPRESEATVNLSSIGQVLQKQPVPLLSSPPLLAWHHPAAGEPIRNRLRFPFPKFRNQAFLDARQWAMAFSVFSSSNRSQVGFKL